MDSTSTSAWKKATFFREKAGGFFPKARQLNSSLNVPGTLQAIALVLELRASKSTYIYYYIFLDNNYFFKGS